MVPYCVPLAQYKKQITKSLTENALTLVTMCRRGHIKDAMFGITSSKHLQQKLTKLYKTEREEGGLGERR